MDEIYYDMIFKRKSFHLFKNTGEANIVQQEIEDIKIKFNSFLPLDSSIKTAIRIVNASETTCNRGEEYCILLYSEKKDNYLENIGYIGEQLDLYLVSKNIGTLWFGIGKTNETSFKGLDFVIMIAISKVDDEKKFRKNMFKSKRKEIDEIWIGKEISKIADIIRFAPSSCNTQPWIVECVDNKLNVFRYKKEGKRGIMPANKVTYYNKIDIGIFLCFIDICLQREGFRYNVKLYTDRNLDKEQTKIATYHLYIEN